MSNKTSRIPTLPRPSRVEKAAPRPPAPAVTTGKRLPPCPDYLGKHGQKAYSSAVQTLRDLKLEDAADARVVEAFAGAYEDYREAREVVDAEGMTYKTFTQTGELRWLKRPEVEIAADAWRRMSTALSQMCMTPVSRSKGKPGGKPAVEEDPFAMFLPKAN